MELDTYIMIIRRWWWLLLLCLLLGGGAGYTASQFQTPVYQARTTLVVGRFIQDANPDSNEILTSQRLAQNYVEMARRELVLRAAGEGLGLDRDWTDLARQVTARVVLNTQILEIVVTDTDPQVAQHLADEVARQLIAQSPSTEDPEQAEERRFIKEQIAGLKERIVAGQAQLQELQAALELETTVKGRQRRQEELDVLQENLNTWQANYTGLLDITLQQDTGANYLTVIEPAALPAGPANASLTRNVLLAAAVGLLIALGVAFLLEYLDNTLKSPEEAQKALELPALGAIPAIRPVRGKNGQPGGLVNPDQPAAATLEAYRMLRANLQFAGLALPKPAASYLITSASPGEGKSTTAANLAIVLAQAGKRVILVDADLRRPVLHRYFRLSNKTGLTSLLLDESLPPEAALLPTPVAGLALLPSGPLPPNAADLMASPRMAGLIARLEAQADLVIFDSPPLLVVADASMLAPRLGAALLVVEAGRTPRPVGERARQALLAVGVRPLGLVLNKFNPRRANAAYYPYYKGYHHYYTSTNGDVC